MYIIVSSCDPSVPYTDHVSSTVTPSHVLPLHDVCMPSPGTQSRIVLIDVVILVARLIVIALKVGVNALTLNHLKLRCDLTEASLI